MKYFILAACFFIGCGLFFSGLSQLYKEPPCKKDYGYPDIPIEVKQRAWDYAEKVYCYGQDPDSERVAWQITDFFNGAMYQYQMDHP